MIDADEVDIHTVIVNELFKVMLLEDMNCEELNM
jgi:hypothetical protein